MTAKRCHRYSILAVTSGVRRKFPRGGQSFVTIVWRHKST